MGIYRRGKVWWIDYYDQNRMRVQESSYSSDRRIARDLLSVRESEVLRGVFKRPVKISFGDFSQKYMEYAKTNKRSWLRDEQMLKHLQGYFGTQRAYRRSLPSILRVTNSNGERKSQGPQ